MIGSLKLGNDNQNFNMREVSIEDENENIDLEINRQAHLIGSIQEVERPLVVKKNEIIFKNHKDIGQISDRSQNSKLYYTNNNDYANLDVNG